VVGWWVGGLVGCSAVAVISRSDATDALAFLALEMAAKRIGGRAPLAPTST
jgi:hypothetical protein